MNRIIHRVYAFLCVGGIGLLGSCAHMAPPELVSARQAYEHASVGQAPRLAPAELHDAGVALQRAETAFAHKPKAFYVRDLAYVAQRQAEMAEVTADTLQNRQARAQAEQEFQNRQAQMAQQARGDLLKTRQQLALTESARQQSMTQLSAEQRARQEAEQKAAAAEAHARDALSKLASVHEEERGLVITLSGSVLFASDQAMLLPEAQVRLNQVAETLMETRDRNLLVEGHTDSRGSEGHNLDLSQRRADAVRSYLITRGYPAERIQARGMGKANPVADNTSPEGRANNRRVEIVVQPPRP